MVLYFNVYSKGKTAKEYLILLEIAENKDNKVRKVRLSYKVNISLWIYYIFVQIYLYAYKKNCSWIRELIINKALKAFYLH